MPIPFWAGHYIGLPFKEHGRDRSGIDCWGLVRLIFQEQMGIALPSYRYDYAGTRDAGAIGALITRVVREWETIDMPDARLGDAVVFCVNGAPLHVGMVIGDMRMLHIERFIDSAIENYSAPRWQKRIHGFYRPIIA